MVLAGDNDVFHARVFGQLCYFCCIKIDGVKGFRHFHIFPDRNIGHARVHDPFANAVVRFAIDFVGKLSIWTPVDKHGVIAITKELTPFCIFSAQCNDIFAPKRVHFPAVAFLHVCFPLLDWLFTPHPNCSIRCL